jgi:hypothetical protein
VISPDEVIRLAHAGEGPSVEFKRRLPRSDRVVRTLCAFANTAGGTLLVGVTDRGRIHGVHRADEVAEELALLARHAIAPELRVRTVVVAVESTPIVVCRVPESAARPHSVLDPSGVRECMIRVGASNRRAAGDTMRALGRPIRRRTSLSRLEKLVLAWVRSDALRSLQPGGSATVRGFARAHNVGETRARRAFQHLVRDGWLVAHGRGTTRIYAPA